MDASPLANLVYRATGVAPPRRSAWPLYLAEDRYPHWDRSVRDSGDHVRSAQVSSDREEKDDAITQEIIVKANTGTVNKVLLGTARKRKGLNMRSF